MLTEERTSLVTSAEPFLGARVDQLQSSDPPILLYLTPSHPVIPSFDPAPTLGTRVRYQ
jgi:hypothetical protein